MNKQELRTNKQELISKYELLKNSYNFKVVATDGIISDLKRLDEPETGHADEAPRYVKNILARLRELPLHDREVWLKAIMGEFEQDFSHAKWREGYEQGKFEGEWAGQQLKDADKIRQELNKPVIPQFVADWYEKHKDDLEYDIWEYILHWGKQQKSEFYEWMNHANNKPFQTLVNMHQYGYEVEEEKRYLVKVKGVNGYACYLNKGLLSKEYFFESKNEIGGCRTKHTRKQLEDDDFGWVFDCPGIEIEEVE
jgi:gp178